MYEATETTEKAHAKVLRRYHPAEGSWSTMPITLAEINSITAKSEAKQDLSLSERGKVAGVVIRALRDLNDPNMVRNLGEACDQFVMLCGGKKSKHPAPRNWPADQKEKRARAKSDGPRIPKGRKLGDDETVNPVFQSLDSFIQFVYSRAVLSDGKFAYGADELNQLVSYQKTHNPDSLKGSEFHANLQGAGCVMVEKVPFLDAAIGQETPAGMSKPEKPAKPGVVRGRKPPRKPAKGDEQASA